MILITTSRRPTRRIRSLIKDLFRVIPGAVRVNRGKMNIRDVAMRALREGFCRAMIVGRYKGNPGRIRFLKVTPSGFEYIPPVVFLSGITLRREMTDKRAPQGRDMAIITFSDEEEEVLRFARSLAYAFNREMFVVDKLDDIGGIYEDQEYDVFLAVKADREGFALRFYYAPELEELGPRLRVGRVIYLSLIHI